MDQMKAAMIVMALVNLALLVLSEHGTLSFAWSWLVIVGTAGTMILALLFTGRSASDHVAGDVHPPAGAHDAGRREPGAQADERRVAGDPHVALVRGEALERHAGQPAHQQVVLDRQIEREQVGDLRAALVPRGPPGLAVRRGAELPGSITRCSAGSSVVSEIRTDTAS